MSIWTGTVSVTNGSKDVDVVAGDLLTFANCPPDALAIATATGTSFIVEDRDAVTPTIKFTLRDAWPGATNAALAMSIWPVSESTTTMLELMQVAARLTQQFNIVEKRGPLFLNFGAAGGTGDPGPGNIRLSDESPAVDDAVTISISDTSANGQPVGDLVGAVLSVNAVVMLQSATTASYIAVQLPSGISSDAGRHFADGIVVGVGGLLSPSEPLVVTWAQPGSSLEAHAAGTFAERDGFDAEAAGFFYLADHLDGDPDQPAALYRRNTAVAGVWSVGIPFQGPAGDKGWSPIIVSQADGARRVLRLTDWIGGEGTKPTATGYLSAGGVVATAAEATDIRGETGAKGEPVGALGTFKSATADADPGPGCWRFNHVDPALADMVYIDNVDAAGNDMTVRLLAFNAVTNANVRGYLRWQSAIAAGTAIEAAVTGDVVAAVGYLKAPIAHISGAAFAADLSTVLVPQVGASGGIDGTDPGLLLTGNDTAADADPGAGMIAADAEDLSEATMLVVSKTNRYGVAIATALLRAGVSTNAVKATVTLTRTDAGGAGEQTTFDLSGVTEAADRIKLLIAAGTLGGVTALVDAANYSLQFSRDGNAGVADAASVVGAINTADVKAAPAGADKTLLSDSEDAGSAKAATFDSLRPAIGTLGAAETVLTDTATIDRSAAGEVTLLNAATSKTLNYAAAATLGADFAHIVKNIGAGTWTLDPDGAETIDGAATLTLGRGESLVVTSNGAALRTSLRSSGGVRGSAEISNLGLAASVGASALTIAMKTAAATADPSPANPVLIAFRSATAGTGAFAVRSVEAALSLTVTSGATLGQTSGQVATLHVYAIDNAGTVELAVSGSDIGESGIISTTVMSAAADSADAIYSATARANVAYRKIGELTNTQAAAGTWAAVPSTIRLAPFDPNEWLALPVGGYRILDTSLAGVRRPPTISDNFRYVELTAGLTDAGEYNAGVLTGESVTGTAPLIDATAAVAHAGSSMNGQTIHLFNTEGRILRPSTAAGTLQDDQLQDHTHNVRTGVGSGSTLRVTATSNSGSNVGPETSGPSAGVRVGDETRMRNMGETAFRRIA